MCTLELYIIEFYNHKNNVLGGDYMLHIILGDEEFIPIKDPKHTFSRYRVSNKGRIKNIRTGKILKPSVSKGKRNKGYTRVTLFADEDFNTGHKLKGHSTPVHKIVTNSFYGIRPDNLVVNHINGIKSDNDIHNLEYCTPRENTQHAIRTGLIVPKYGEDCYNTKYPDSMIRQICEDLQNGMYVTDVSKKYNIPISIISSIFHKQYRKYITDDYNFDTVNYKYKQGNFKKYTDAEVDEICKYLEDPNATITKAAKHFNINYVIISDIAYGRYKPEISSNYDLSHVINRHSDTPTSLVIQICELLQNGVSVNKIARQLGIDHNIVSGIKARKRYADISKNYDFSKCSIRETIDKDMTIAIADMLKAGYSKKVIANKLGVSVETVRKVRKRRLGKPWINDYVFD